MYKAILFDVDGTALDTRFVLGASRDAYRDLRGYELSEETLDKMYGSPVSHLQGLLDMDDEEYARFNERFRHYLPFYVSKQQLFEGIRDCMEECRKLGIILALNTSRTVPMTYEASAALDWDFAKFCDYVIGCDLVEHPKPAPDSLLYAAKLFGVELSEMLFVGDTEFDCSCAANAGVDFALATWGSKEQLPAKYYPKHPMELVDIVKNS